MTNRPMYNVASAVSCRSLAIVRSLPLPGCEIPLKQTSTQLLLQANLLVFSYLMQLELFFKIGYVCTGQGGGMEQDRTKFAVLILCDDSHVT